jgi:diguanylate cyclase (GGDEF)-like protein
LTEYERTTLFVNDTTGSVLEVPIVTGDRCVGTLTYYSRAVNAFHDRHVRVGLYLANLAALSIERARVHAALEEQAITDGLTGLLNHRAVQDRLEAEISRANREGRPLAVLMIDIDQFKQINDTHGHLTGDRTLQEVSKCLRRSVRLSDHVGRYGGDEFLIVLPGAEQGEALIAAERILRNTSLARVMAGDELVDIQLSVGVAIYPMDGSDSPSLIAAADHSMYAAKQLHASQPPRVLPIETARPKRLANTGAGALGRPIPL